MRSYIGITIGPIGDTIGDARTPAALWFASNLFSDITRRICSAISGEDGFQDIKIYSPYYAKDIKVDDGVGKFHDRIIFSTTDFEHSKMRDIIKRVKSETIWNFPQEAQIPGAEDFLQEYLQIHYVVKEEDQLGDKNSVLVFSPYLDALELMKTFPSDDSSNPIMKLFLGETNNGNKFIKESPLFKRVTKETNQLRKENDRIWTIEEIASGHGTIKEALKRKHYYAIVSADGDGMGKFLEKLSNDMVTDFSRVCLAYDEKAAELIGNYGGMTIYAGGDDLLFLAPVMTDIGDIFGLCNQIQNLFGEEINKVEEFKKIATVPTISFGVSIQYEKYPLYEALDSSRKLLALAKKDGDLKNTECKKNNMAIELQKHSGQSLSLMVSNECYEAFKEFMQIRDSNEGNTIQSVLYTLETFHSLIFVLNQEAREQKITLEAYKLAWNNMFDNIGQAHARTYIDTISETYYRRLVMGKERIIVPSHGLTESYIQSEKQSIQTDASLKTLIYLLKLKQFLAEKEGARE